MSFPLPNNILQLPDVAVKQLLQKVVVMQNGDVSKAMRKAGYKYPINYGVSIPQLRDLATRYKPDQSLAVQLRQHSNIREALILSSMLDEPEKLSLNETLKICKYIDNIELVEQFSRNLFALLPNLVSLCKDIIDNSEICRTTCFMSIGWAIKFNKSISKNNISWVIEQLSNDNYMTNQQVYKAILFLMQAIETHIHDFSKEIHRLAEKFSKSDKKSVVLLGNEFLWLNVV